MMRKVVWKWFGDNEFVPGVHARDLLEGEADARGVEDIVKESKLYVRVVKAAAKKEIKDGA